MQPSGKGSQRFGSERRLLQRAEFQRVFEAGQRTHGRYLTIIAAPGQHRAARLGIVASRKFGNAVHRNRAKRLIREVFRRTDSRETPGLDLIVIPRRELLDAAYANFEHDFRATLKRSASRVGRATG